MEYSIVNSLDVNLDDRIDAEYFSPSYLENERKLLKVNALPLSHYLKLTTSAFYPSATAYYATGDVLFIRCVDCIDFPAITKLQNHSFERLPSSFIKKHKTIKMIKDGDIVITKVGSPCFASVLYNIGKAAISRTVLGAHTIKGISPFYLVVFLRSKYGFDQLIRERELTIQYQLTLERVKRILVYKPTDYLQEKIKQLFIESQELKMSQERSYRQAEELLLSELGLLHWKPKHSLTFIKHFSDLVEAERIDAEYFQPQYDEAIQAVKSYKGGYDILDDLTELVGHPTNPPYATTHQNDQTFIVTQKHLSKYFLKDNFCASKDVRYTTENFMNRNQEFILQKNDILLYSVGAPCIGRANIYRLQTKATIGSFLTLIRPKKEKINPFFLLVFLNSKIGTKLTGRNSRGAIQQYIYPYDTKRIPIPKLSFDKQLAIEELVINSQKADRRSHALLEIAKRGVELAIETSEEEAAKWIDSELAKLDQALEDKG